MAFHLSHVPPPASAAGPADDGGLWECGRCGFVNKTATDRACKGCGGAPPPNTLGNGNPAPASSPIPPVPSRPTYAPQQAAYPAQQPHAAPYAASSVSAPTPAAAAPAPFKIPVPAARPSSASVYSSAPPGASPYAPAVAPSAPSAPPYEPAGPTTTPYASSVPPGASPYVPGAAPSAVPAAYAPPAAANPPYASAPPGVPPYVPGGFAAPPATAYAPPAAPMAPSYAPSAQPQPHQVQSQQTFRVPVPPGTQPGQKIGVDTGGAAPVLVTVPQRTEWGGSGAQQFFHVQLPRPTTTAAAPVMVQGSSVQTSSHHNNGTMGGIVGSITAAAHNNNGSMGGLVGSITSAATAAAAAAGIAAPAAHGSSGYNAPPASSGGGAHTLTPISPRHVTTTPTKLILKEKAMSFTGDDASVKDESGNTLFKIKADMMTMSQRRKMYDASSGQVIGQLRLKKSAFMQPTVYVGTPNDEKKCHVKMTGMLNPLKCNANVYVGETKVGRVSGNYKAKQFEINSVDGKTLATVSKKLTASSYFMDADSYCIYCYPGVDLAFMALVVVSLDELYNDDD